MGAFYWERHPRGPFATLIAVAATYCHPKAYLGEPVSPARRADDPPRSRPGSRQSNGGTIRPNDAPWWDGMAPDTR